MTLNMRKLKRLGESLWVSFTKEKEYEILIVLAKNLGLMNGVSRISLFKYKTFLGAVNL